MLTCATQTISVTATGGVSYSWSGGLGNNADASITSAGTYTVTVTGANGCTNTASITVTQNVTPPVAAITNNSNTTTLTCATQSISVTATGGVSYAWSGGLGNNAGATITQPGTYTVTVTGANGCTATASIDITQDLTQPTVAINNITGTTVLTCSTTSVSVTATGGVSYSWNGGSSPSTATNSFNAAGTYTVTVTGANGCTNTSSIQITQDVTVPTAGITNNTGVTVLNCTTTSINVTATGGASYSWNGGATPNSATNSFTAPGTYTVTVTGAGGCTATASILITQDVTPPTAAISNNTGTTVLTCATQTISVTATGGVSYSWSGGLGNNADASITSAGTYTVTVTGANGCTNTASITVTQNVTPPVAAITNNSNTTVLTCATQSISVTATGGVSYAWSGGLGNNAGATITQPGTYTVTVTGSNGCTATANINITQNITVPGAPSVNITQPTCSTATGTITVTSPTGAGYSYSIDGINYSNVSGVFSGLGANSYSVTVKNSNGCISNETIAVINAAPSTPVAPSLSVIQPTCLLQSGTITVTSPTGAGYSYSIDGVNYSNITGVFSGLAGNSYNVTVKNSSGCISSATNAVISTAPVTPAAPTITLTQPTCTVPTGTITITAPTGGGYSYSIDGTNYSNASGVFSGLAQGSYDVTDKNGSGCISNATTVVINAQPSGPAAPTVSITQPTCATATGTITVSAPTGAGLTYSINGTTYQIKQNL